MRVRARDGTLSRMTKRIFLLGTFVALALACARGHDDGAIDPLGGDGGVPALDGFDTPSCREAADKKSSVACDYYAVHMDGSNGAQNGCFVAFVANTSSQSTRIEASFGGAPIDLAAHVKLPSGSGTSLTYGDYDPSAGVPPGQVAIVFLAGPPEPGDTPSIGNANTGFKEPVKCPVKPALSALTQIIGSGFGRAFRIRTDHPVVAYQMLPYGGGSAAVTGATLLIPTSAWGTNLVAVDAYGAGDLQGNGKTSLDIVAQEDGTKVTILPKVDILSSAALQGGKANVPRTYDLDRGQTLQITQTLELTGSPIESNKPISLFAGMPCMNVPRNIGYCDHGEQQIPHIRAMGSEYLGAPYRQRTSKIEDVPWRIVGVVDGTKLSYDPPGEGPSTLAAGQVAEFTRNGAFRVKSQDKDHPFLLVGYMTGADMVDNGGYGDADFVRAVPTAQFLDRYVFFTDPTYPETDLVVTRKVGGPPVSLDCYGTIDAWKPLGSAWEVAHVDLSRHDFQAQGSCDNGVHEMKSAAPFGLTVWGWGTPETTKNTGYVSYGYPAGENLATLTDTYVPPQPK